MDVVLCGRADPDLVRRIRDEMPEVIVYTLNASPAKLLDWQREPWPQDVAEAKRRTWIRACRDTRRLGGISQDGGIVEIVEPKAQAGDRWPSRMSDEIRVGVLGDLLDAVENETEADPAAIAFDFLVRFGNAVGRGPHFTVSGDRHGCNLFATVVGDTGQGRKGSSAAFPKRVLELAAPEWAGSCTKTGLSSGEGIIYALRDPGPSGRMDKDGEPIIDQGVEDKRLFVIEPELARTLKAASRRDNVLAPVLRQAWEGARLATMTKAPYCATGAHVSLLAHVTPTEFRHLLKDDDVHGGTVNRFLFVASKRQRQLPFGGDVPDAVLTRLADATTRAIKASEFCDEMLFSDGARQVWPGMYDRLQGDEQAPGITGALLGRATAQVRRLAMIFALLDQAHEVATAHLGAAMEVWRYSRETVAMVFGTSTGNRVADRILGELQGTPTIDRSEMHALFDRHVSAADIDAGLAVLHKMRLATGKRIPTGGRPREVWQAIEGGK